MHHEQDAVAVYPEPVRRVRNRLMHPDHAPILREGMADHRLRTMLHRELADHLLARPDLVAPVDRVDP